MSEQFGNDYVVLTDEDGNEVEFEHIDTVEVDGTTLACPLRKYHIPVSH